MHKAQGNNRLHCLIKETVEPEEIALDEDEEKNEIIAQENVIPFEIKAEAIINIHESQLNSNSHCSRLNENLEPEEITIDDDDEKKENFRQDVALPFKIKSEHIINDMRNGQPETSAQCSLLKKSVEPEEITIDDDDEEIDNITQINIHESQLNANWHCSLLNENDEPEEITIDDDDDEKNECITQENELPFAIQTEIIHDNLASFNPSTKTKSTHPDSDTKESAASTSNEKELMIPMTNLDSQTGPSDNVKCMFDGCKFLTRFPLVLRKHELRCSFKDISILEMSYCKYKSKGCNYTSRLPSSLKIHEFLCSTQLGIYTKPLLRNNQQQDQQNSSLQANSITNMQDEPIIDSHVIVSIEENAMINECPIDHKATKKHKSLHKKAKITKPTNLNKMNLQKPMFKIKIEDDQEFFAQMAIENSILAQATIFFVHRNFQAAAILFRSQLHICLKDKGIKMPDRTLSIIRCLIACCNVMETEPPLSKKIIAWTLMKYIQIVFDQILAELIDETLCSCDTSSQNHILNIGLHILPSSDFKAEILPTDCNGITLPIEFVLDLLKASETDKELCLLSLESLKCKMRKKCSTCDSKFAMNSELVNDLCPICVTGIVL